VHTANYRCLRIYNSRLSVTLIGNGDPEIEQAHSTVQNKTDGTDKTIGIMSAVTLFVCFVNPAAGP
jgi:hypothetical protein